MTENSTALSRFLHTVEEIWRKWFSRRNRWRSQTWAVNRRHLQRYPLAPARAFRSIYARAAKP